MHLNTKRCNDTVIVSASSVGKQPVCSLTFDLCLKERWALEETLVVAMVTLGVCRDQMTVPCLCVVELSLPEQT